MQLEKQVVSLELAKKLKKLGIRQESLFYWMQCSHSNGISYINHIDDFCDTDTIASGFLRSFAAFTATELGEMLPKEIEIDNYDYNYLGYLTHGEIPGQPCYFDEYGGAILFATAPKFSDSEANARAKMLIYLIENGLMEAPRV